MKKIISFVMIGMMLIAGGAVFADDNDAITAAPVMYIATPVLISENIQSTDLYYDEERIASDVQAQIIDGKMMLPLRVVLEELGFEVTWNQENKSVEMVRGAQWTKITIGENSYFKNKMAPIALSEAPVIIENRTMVPVEFFYEIANIAFQVENRNITFLDDQMAVHSGFIKDIAYDENGNQSITLTTDMASDDIMYQTIIHTSDEITFFNKEISIGTFINVISPPIMTMSIPGQTAGYVIY